MSVLAIEAQTTPVSVLPGPIETASIAGHSGRWSGGREYKFSALIGSQYPVISVNVISEPGESFQVVLLRPNINDGASAWKRSEHGGAVNVRPTPPAPAHPNRLRQFDRLVVSTRAVCPLAIIHFPK